MREHKGRNPYNHYEGWTNVFIMSPQRPGDATNLRARSGPGQRISALTTDRGFFWCRSHSHKSPFPCPLDRPAISLPP